ncbi:MAG: hypothetical protein II889_01710 [Clostridia bacterium]|nr:hypothetical protein [Clostridia bacterium]
MRICGIVFCAHIVYYYVDENGKRKQKWESFKNANEAKKRQAEITYKEQIGTFVVPKSPPVAPYVLIRYTALIQLHLIFLCRFSQECYQKTKRISAVLKSTSPGTV